MTVLACAVAQGLLDLLWAGARQLLQDKRGSASDVWRGRTGAAKPTVLSKGASAGGA